MAEFIPAVMHSNFPFQHSRPKTERKREKTGFSQWLAHKPVNLNDESGETPLLSMEDELMLAKLRELARPFPSDMPYPASGAVNPYAKAAAAAPQEDGIDENGQYELPLLLTPSGELINEQI